MKLGYFFVLGFLFLPSLVLANIEISEIMYSLGSDDWIEIFNNSNEEIDIIGWRIYEGTSENKINHRINLVNEDGNFKISANSYVVIADNASNFLMDWPSFSGIIFDSLFSLINAGEEIIIRDSEKNDIDSVFYNSEWGANGDGNSLQKIDGSWFASIPTPGLQNSSTDLGQEDELDGDEEESNVASAEPVYIPPEDLPSIKAHAGKDRIMILGALSEFRGESFGINNQPLENARYLWNFGDGTLKEGQNIAHSYRFIGEYTVYLDVSSGGYSTSDTLVIKVMPNEVLISEIKTGVDSFVELRNKSKNEINVSGWRFQSGSQRFTFAKNSFIRPYSFLVIPASSSGLLLPSGQGIVELLYPGGFLTDTFEYNGFLKEGESFSKDQGITPETPGAKNAKSEVQYVEESVEVRVPEEVGLQQIDDDQTVEIRYPKDIGSQDVGATTTQANVIATTGNDTKSNKTLYYFLGVFGLAILASLGVFFIRRNRTV